MGFRFRRSVKILPGVRLNIANPIHSLPPPVPSATRELVWLLLIVAALMWWVVRNNVTM